jgi:hypothetical protein
MMSCSVRHTPRLPEGMDEAALRAGWDTIKATTPFVANAALLSVTVVSADVAEGYRKNLHADVHLREDPVPAPVEPPL